jgi:hypothetical protein
MGRSSDQLMDDAKRAGKEKLDEVKSALSEAPEPAEARPVQGSSERGAQDALAS